MTTQQTKLWYQDIYMEATSEIEHQRLYTLRSELAYEEFGRHSLMALAQCS